VGRRYGQHFLVRETILEKIAVAACGDRVQTVVEIGPGKGALTKHLLGRAERVVALEIDPYLVHYLRQKYRETPQLELVEADVLKADLTQWGPAVVAGNLPYYITSPIIDKVFATGPVWKRAVFLVQKEVAERITASPGSRDYGYLSVQVNLLARSEYLFAVSRAAFAPPPKVESAVVRLQPRDVHADWGLADPAAFLGFASLAFQQKRKTLRNNLRGSWPAIEVQPEARLRAEQLGIGDLIALYRKLV
jgi:16S rRNA (adenine1518-N6/adenine1519-N6)-dimethyltransferase